MIAAPVIAHRGLSSLLPENTFIAVRAADKIGATWVDLDVRVLNDGTPIIFHDFQVERTTDGEGVISSYNYYSIKKLSAGAWFNEKFVDEKIPLLNEMLELLDELNMGLNIRLRLNEDSDDVEHFMQSFFKELKLSPCPPKGLVLSSEDIRIIKQAKQINEKVITASILKEFDKEKIQEAKKSEVSAIYLEKDILLENEVQLAKEYVNYIKNQELEIYTFVVNRKEIGQSMFEFGVDGIFTDNPQNFARYLP